MPWTTAARAREWVMGVDLVVDPAALNPSLTDAEEDLYARLVGFIAQATVDAWTTTVNTPDLVQQWAARMTAAKYMSKYQGYHLQPEIPDNPAANLYDEILKEIDAVKSERNWIIDQAGNRVPVKGIGVSQHTMYVHELPVSQGGEP